MAWLIGWGLTLEYLFAPSTVAVGFSDYFGSLLRDIGITIPAMFSSAPFDYDVAGGWHMTGAVINLPAMIIIAILVL